MRYFRLLVVTSAFLLVTAQAPAQTYIESQTLVTDSGIHPKIDGQLIGKGKSVDVFGWFLVTESWGEAVVGVAKSIRPWLWAAVGVGVETNDSPWRVNPNLWIGNQLASSFLTIEHGGSGFWYKSTSFVKLRSRVEAGVHSQRFYGTGPAVQISLGDGYKVWGSVVPGPKSTIGMIKSF